jgi:hypothetical protein
MPETITIEVQGGSQPPDLTGPPRPPAPLVSPGPGLPPAFLPTPATPQPAAPGGPSSVVIANPNPIPVTWAISPPTPTASVPPQGFTPTNAPTTLPTSNPTQVAGQPMPTPTPVPPATTPTPPVAAIAPPSPAFAFPSPLDVRLTELSGQAHREISGAVLSGILAAGRGAPNQPTPAGSSAAPKTPASPSGGSGLRPITTAIVSAGVRAATSALGPGDSTSMLSGISGAASALSAIPGPAGMVAAGLSVAASAVGGFIDAVSGYADKLSPYSPQIAMAQAQAEVTQVLRDMERAQKLGPDLAKFIEAKSRLDQSWEDAKVAFMQKVVPSLTKIVEFLAFMLDGQDEMNKLGERMTKEQRDRANEQIRQINALMGPLAKMLGMTLKEIEENTRKDVDYDALTKAILDIALPAGARLGAGPGANALNLPAFGGF